MKRVVAYLRLSVEDGDDNESQSISNQRKIISKYAKENGLEIKKFYIDDGYSGYKMSRPNFNMLMQDLNEDLVDIVIVKDLSRIGRHNAKVQLFLENILESGKRVLSVNDNYDTYKEETHTIAGFQTLMNEMYVKDISKKVKSSLGTLQKEGKLLCNFPYGYYKDDKDKTKCYVDTYIAQYVKQIFDMYINGMGVNKIAKTLTENNVPTARMARKQRQEADGKTSKINASTDWDASSVLRILQNEFYIGTLVLNKTKSRSIKGKPVSVPDNERLKFEGHHEAIIDKNTFRLTQEIIRQRSKNNFRGWKYKNKKNLFTSIIYCANCGSIMTSSGTSNNNRYICHTYNKFGTSRCTSHIIYENNILEVLLDLLKHCRDNLQHVLKDLSKIIQVELQHRCKQDDNQYDLIKMLEDTKKSLETLIEMKVQEIMKNPSMSNIIDKTYSDMINVKYQTIQSLEQQILDQKTTTIDEVEIKNDVNAAITIINDVLNTKDITRKQILMLVEKLIVHEDGGLDIMLKGNIHELSNNYFKVNETTLNKSKKYLYEFIESHQQRFTKDECVIYLRSKGIKTSYYAVSKIINEEIGEMIEYSALRRGYKIIKPIEEIECVLKNVIGRKCATQCSTESNTVVDTVGRLCNNNVSFELLMQICNWTKSTQYKKNIF